MKKIIVSLIVSLLLVGNVFAATTSASPIAKSACAPSLVKPVKEETRLATVAISPDTLAFDALMVVKITAKAKLNGAKINLPSEFFDLVDYTPKASGSLMAPSPGEWTSTDGLSEGSSYSVTLKAKKWTNYQWKPITYSASNVQGTGYGSDSFYIFYDKIPITISIGQENQIPQSTSRVARKLDFSTYPDASLQIKTNKGELGADIASTSGTSITQTANSDGKASAYIFANEGDKVTISAISSDACQKNSTSNEFVLSRSDVARTFQDYSWIYWLAGGVLLILLIIIFFVIKKKKKPSEPTLSNLNQPNTTPENTDAIDKNLRP
ncbi:MAG: hypothetical protein M1338_00905 [Patescibacteria group bacterium]|nr:hypothetical protein [Patescibacteria group bacterium]